MTEMWEVDWVRAEHPDWSAPEIANELGCLAAYVRKTAQRQGWVLPIKKRMPKFSVAKDGTWVRRKAG